MNSEQWNEEKWNKEQEEFQNIANGLVELRGRKNKDYMNSWTLLGLMGIIFQIMSKAIRIWNLRNKEPDNESLKDSLKDIAVYGMMAIALIDRKETEPKL